VRPVSWSLAANDDVGPLLRIFLHNPIVALQKICEVGGWYVEGWATSLRVSQDPRDRRRGSTHIAGDAAVAGRLSVLDHCADEDFFAR